MPNTLAHIAVNKILSKPFIRDNEIIWVYLGVVIPDFPWILKRIILLLFPTVNGYDLQAYLISLASLFFSIIISLFFAQLFKDTKRIAVLLCFGSLFHLILDSFQTKWANGVQLFLPFNWKILSFNYFWPESIYSLILTLLGLFFAIYTLNSKSKFPNFEFSFQRFARAMLLLSTYFVLPYLLIHFNYENDSHFISTLKYKDNRPGKYIEMDRKEYRRDQNGSYWIRSFNDDYYKLENIDTIKTDRISIRGMFVDKDRIRVLELKESSAFWRDGASYVGLFLILLNLIIMVKNKYPNIN